MEQSEHNDKKRFFYPQATYHGEVKPENLIFNANLQEFDHKVRYITALQTSGTLDPIDAYKQIKELWRQLKNSKKMLNIGEEPRSGS